MGLSKKMKTVYYDLREEKSSVMLNVTRDIYKKMCGILLKDHVLLQIELYYKNDHYSKLKLHHTWATVPTHILSDPPLLEFLDRRNFPEHDPIRFNLLKWMIDREKLKNVDLTLIPRKYFQDIMTLVLLRRYGLMSVLEADLILLSIRNVECGHVPDELKPPARLNARAFQVAFMYTRIFGFVRGALQVVGLEDTMMVRLITFD